MGSLPGTRGKGKEGRRGGEGRGRGTSERRVDENNMRFERRRKMGREGKGEGEEEEVRRGTK